MNKLILADHSKESWSEMIGQPLIEWKGVNLLGDEIEAKMVLRSFKEVKGPEPNCEMDGVEIRFESGGERSTQNLRLTSDIHSKTLDIFVGEPDRFAAFYLAICKALNFGMRPDMILEAGYYAAEKTIGKINKLRILKEGERYVGDEIYRQFCEELSRRFFQDE